MAAVSVFAESGDAPSTPVAREFLEAAPHKYHYDQT
jgi:hypothetical protein